MALLWLAMSYELAEINHELRKHPVAVGTTRFSWLQQQQQQQKSIWRREQGSLHGSGVKVGSNG